MIAKEAIRQIQDAAKIEEVVGDFMSLRRRGTSLVGLCPFHNEKTPSFHVNTAKNIFKCFGCGVAGDSVKFVMEHEHFSYPEALRYLAKKYHIEIQEKEQTPEDILRENEREAMLALNDFAAEYFKDNLKNNEIARAVGLSYFKSREFTSQIIEKFGLGYSLETREHFSKTAISKGYSEEILLKSGLSIKRDDGSLYDRFFGRAIFPIHSVSGKVIGFGGRILSNNSKIAKYLNSPESELFSKSKILYGLFFAKSAISKKDACYLVEGYTDVISMHQAGIENVVASMGTSLTEEQIPLIKRYTQNITILYDGDFAGIKASMRGIDMILAKGMNVKIVLFPEGEDPDSFARTHKSEEVEDFINKNAEDFIKFKTKILLKEVGNDPIKRANLLKEIVITIAIIPDQIARSVYTSECSRLLNFDEKILINEVNKIIRNKFRQSLPEQEQNLIESETHIKPEESQEANLDKKYLYEEPVRLLLQHGNKMVDKELIPILKDEEDDDKKNRKEIVSVKNLIVNIISSEEYHFKDEICGMIFEEFMKSEQDNINILHFYSHESEKIQQKAIDLTELPYIMSPNWQKKEGKIIKTEEHESHLAKVINAWIGALKLEMTEIIRKEIEESLKANPDDLLPLQTLKFLNEEKQKIAKAINCTITN